MQLLQSDSPTSSCGRSDETTCSVRSSRRNDNLNHFIHHDDRPKPNNNNNNNNICDLNLSYNNNCSNATESTLLMCSDQSEHQTAFMGAASAAERIPASKRSSSFNYHSEYQFLTAGALLREPTDHFSIHHTNSTLENDASSVRPRSSSPPLLPRLANDVRLTDHWSRPGITAEQSDSSVVKREWDHFRYNSSGGGGGGEVTSPSSPLLDLDLETTAMPAPGIFRHYPPKLVSSPVATNLSLS